MSSKRKVRQVVDVRWTDGGDVDERYNNCGLQGAGCWQGGMNARGHFVRVFVEAGVRSCRM